MGRELHRLTVRSLAGALARGLYADGGGLYLQVARNGSRSWIFRYKREGKTHYMGLGPLHTVGLAAARDKARTCRELLFGGTDPLLNHRERARQARVDAARAITFDSCAEGYIRAHASAWRNQKHCAQWQSTLAAYAGPVLGSMPVQTIGTAEVLKAIEPIWHVKPETASRVRGRIEAVIDWARVRGYCSGENPARWRGHLDKLLPAKGKVRKAEHHAALPYTEIAAFMTDLRGREAPSAAALEFLILTAARTGEVIGARWDEVDLANRIWTVPAPRMKAGREHRVPLSEQAIRLLQKMSAVRHAEFVFPGGKEGQPLSNMSLLALLRRLGRDDLTAHGFRATFRTWASERTSVAREVAEAALAHSSGSKLERAYQRGDLFQKRRRLMDQWAQFCAAPATGSSRVLTLTRVG